MAMNSRATTRFGVLVPFTNTNLESDFIAACPPGVSLHFARLGGYDRDEIPDENQMAGLGASPVEEPLQLVAGVRPHAVFYGCTSATLSHGTAFDQALAEKIRQASGSVTITAAGAVQHAISRLGVSRLGFASPYVAQLNDRAIAFLESGGVNIVSRVDHPEVLDNYGQAALAPQEVFDMGVRANSDDAEAVLLSCTDMRAMEVISELESAINKPVVTSNQAMLFNACEALGLAPPDYPLGRLFQAITGQKTRERRHG